MSLDETKIPTKESDFGYIDPTNVRHVMQKANEWEKPFAFRG